VASGDDEALELAKRCILGQNAVTLDSEGVDLSRCGSVCVVQVGTRESGCFLFDTLGESAGILAFLKEVLENADVTKIIHDCKMDSDAFFHLWGITLTGVHDTQICDSILRGMGQKNLNDTLLGNGIPCNLSRDQNVYKMNPAFWATRPMTERMIEWASGDVASLFQLYDKQTNPSISPQKRRMLATSSQSNADMLRRMMFKTIQRPMLHRIMGKFIGKAGAGIQSLMKNSTFIYFRGKKEDGMMMLYAENELAMRDLEERILDRESRINSGLRY